MSTQNKDTFKDKKEKLKTWLSEHSTRLKQLADYTGYTESYILQLAKKPSVDIPHYTWRQIEMSMHELKAVVRIES